MASALKWYLHKLKTYPMRTNLSTALVLMTVGDVMAQELEHYHLGDSFAGKSKADEVPPVLQRRISLRRYGTHGKDLKKENNSTLQRRNNRDDDNDDATIGSSLAAFAQNLSDKISNEIAFLDPFRLVTMVFFNVGVTTPAYMFFYRYCDGLFLKRTPLSIATRVLATLAFSVPMNALFFTYGTCVHHAAAWYVEEEGDEHDEWHRNREALLLLSSDYPHDDKTLSEQTSIPFDWNAMWTKAYLKNETELPTTMVNSASIWIPINFVSFAVVPSHLRPLLLMVCSVFWNCYLSIVQHRDVVVVVVGAAEANSEPYSILGEDQHDAGNSSSNNGNTMMNSN